MHSLNNEVEFRQFGSDYELTMKPQIKHRAIQFYYTKHSVAFKTM